MANCSPSTKLLAVVHVGVLSGVVSSTSQTPQPEPASEKFEIHGAALDVCRQTMIRTTSTTDSYTVMVTKNAVDDGEGVSFDSVKLVPASAYVDAVNSLDYNIVLLSLLFTISSSSLSTALFVIPILP